MARLLGVIPTESAAGLRLRALVLAYLLTGRWRSEILNLRRRDLDLEGGFYRYTGKGGKERQRALAPPVQQAILAYTRAAGLAGKPEEAVFPGRWRDQPVDGKYIGEQLRQAAELGGISCSGRCTRCATATPTLCAGWRHPWKAGLDHSNLATTSIYLRQLEGREDPWWPSWPVSWGSKEGRGGGAGGEAVVSSAGDNKTGLSEELRRRRTALGWTLASWCPMGAFTAPSAT